MPRLPALPRATTPQTLLCTLDPSRPSRIPIRTLTTTAPHHHQQPPPSSSRPPQPPYRDFPDPPEPSEPRYNFYRTHGRAFLKSFTLAFLTMQIVQTAWLVFEAEEIQDAKNAQIEELKGEVRLLDEGRGSHQLKVGDGEEGRE
jgi:hypothetical protein